MASSIWEIKSDSQTAEPMFGPREPTHPCGGPETQVEPQTDCGAAAAVHSDEQQVLKVRMYAAVQGAGLALSRDASPS